MKVVVCCIILCGFVFAREYFPISAFHVDDTLWFHGAGEDSLGLNLIMTDSTRNDIVKQKVLRVAGSEGLQCMLWNAVRGTQAGVFNRNELEWYGRLYWTNWEVDSSNFDQCIGSRAEDSLAQNRDAWKATVGVDTAGTLIEGPTRWARTRSSGTYDVLFTLKIETLGDTTTKVCSLWVKNGDTLKTQKVVKVADFSAVCVYDTISLSYPNYWCNNIHYGIHWYGNRTLWADYIETKDGFIEDVLRDVYRDTLFYILDRYNDSLALDYFYLLDEPDIGQLRLIDISWISLTCMATSLVFRLWDIGILTFTKHILIL